jgi:hypothetical protein
MHQFGLRQRFERKPYTQIIAIPVAMIIQPANGGRATDSTYPEKIVAKAQTNGSKPRVTFMQLI